MKNEIKRGTKVKILPNLNEERSKVLFGGAVAHESRQRALAKAIGKIVTFQNYEFIENHPNLCRVSGFKVTEDDHSRDIRSFLIPLSSIEVIKKVAKKQKETSNYNIFYNSVGNGTYNVYIIPDHYSHSQGYINEVVKYAKTISTVPRSAFDRRVEVLAGPRFKGMLSLEYNSKTKPKKGMLLKKNSGLWDWLKY
jgi:hypothetical protein